MVIQLTSRETKCQELVDRNVKQAGRLRAGINSIENKLIERLQMELLAYLSSAFAALESPTGNLS